MVTKKKKRTIKLPSTEDTMFWAAIFIIPFGVGLISVPAGVIAFGVLIGIASLLVNGRQEG